MNNVRVLGSVNFTVQNTEGGLDGLFYNNVGEYAGKASGNAKAGGLALVYGVTNVIAVKGSFNGDTYKGRYEVVGTSSVNGTTGALEMTRR